MHIDENLAVHGQECDPRLDAPGFLLDCLKRGPEEARLRVGKATQALIEQMGKGLDLAETNLTNLDLSGFDLRRANLNRTMLFGANLEGANLEGASMVCTGTERTSFRNASLKGAYVHALAAQVCDFRDADLSNLVDATGSLFHGNKMNGVKLDGSVLSGSSFYQCNLEGASFKKASLQGSTINECMLGGAVFWDSTLAQVTITKCHADGLDLSKASGDGVTLQRLTSCKGMRLTTSEFPCLRLLHLRSAGIIAGKLHAPNAQVHDCIIPESRFQGANFSGSMWTRSELRDCGFSGARLEEASMVHVNAECARLDEVSAENFRACETCFDAADMTAFAGRTAVFRDCSMAGVNWRQAYLYRAMITGDPPLAMNLAGADLISANLVQAYVAANLSDANLENANLAYARLNQSAFAQANLNGSNLYQTSLVKANFQDCRLAGIKGPFFADRCPGLEAALDRDCPSLYDEFLTEMNLLFRKAGHGST